MPPMAIENLEREVAQIVLRHDPRAEGYFYGSRARGEGSANAW